MSNSRKNYVIIADASQTKWAQASRARRVAKNAAKKDVEDSRVKYTPETQPRDPDGKFRRILARLKVNLGTESTKELASKIEETEAAQVAGNYDKMRLAGGDLVKMLNSIDTGSLPKGAVKNLRRGAEDLGKVLAYLPLPQGDESAKVRFTDLPPASSELVRNMVRRAKDNLQPDVAKKYIEVLEQFMSGARTMTSDEMAEHLNKLLRVLA